LGKILVVGGAGYIGSHMVKALHQAGYEPVTLDNLATGYADAVRYGELVQGDLGDARLLDELLGDGGFQGVMHFAAFSLVGESVEDPAKYYRNNVAGTLTLLEAMARHSVPAFIFSSTAAVFGEPDYAPIDEAHPVRPINPYGASKWMVERMLADFDAAHGLRSVSLRYFNAAGADPDGELGERHDPETHLIPIVLQAASGRRSHVAINGTDYPTGDGTCVRDYIHVADLCQAHLLALERLLQGAGSAVYNLGNGAGYSIRQVIDTVRAVTGRAFEVREGPRRPGDPARLVADSGKAREALGWEPRLGLEAIVRHAWAWERVLAGGVPEAGAR
jgi:UDP-glucose 4-epimerase